MKQRTRSSEKQNASLLQVICYLISGASAKANIMVCISFGASKCSNVLREYLNKE